MLLHMRVQLGQYCSMYSMEYEDYIPLASNNPGESFTWGPSWIPLLWRYAHPGDKTNSSDIVTRLHSLAFIVASHYLIILSIGKCHISSLGCVNLT